MSTHKRKIHLALWQTPASGLLILNDPWPASTLPPICIEDQPLPLHHTTLDTEAYYTSHVRHNGNITFFLYAEHYPRTDFKKNPPWLLGSFNHWQEALQNKKWQLQPNKKHSPEYWTLTVPSEKVPTNQRHEFKFMTQDGQWLEPPAIAPNQTNPWGMSNYQVSHRPETTQFFTFTLPPNLPTTNRPTLRWVDPQHEESYELPHPSDYSEHDFDLKLGALVEDGITTFRIFAPRAEEVTVQFHPKGQTKLRKVLPLVRKPGGIWEASFPAPLEHYHYNFSIDGENTDPTTAFNPKLRLTDPYSMALASPAGPSVILPTETPQHPNFTPPAPQDLVITEVHLRDVLAKAPIQLTDKERRGFSGLTKWLKTGDTYFHHLGVNAVELLPVHEFDAEDPKEYQWGYMPVNLFSPSSCYAKNPKSGSQVEEFQELVHTFHAEGFAVILDVVLNHQGIHTPLHAIDKGYYFEMDASMELLNWSGCGNDMRTSSPMTQRLLVDSLLHWVRHYDVDGFRFDLAELIGLETLFEIEEKLKKEKPGIHLIAEPWSFRGHIAQELRDTNYTSWNDGYRNFVHKYVYGHENSDGLSYFIGGSKEHFATYPAQTLNYLASHDDRCWIDKLTENPNHNGQNPTELDILRTHLAVGILHASFGIPMIAGGLDFLRSKSGVNNTYLRGDLNILDYSREKEFPNTVQYVRDWIAFRRSNIGKLLRQEHFPSDQNFKIYTQPHAPSLAYHLQGEGQHIVFAINPSEHPSHIEIPTGLPELYLWADQEKFFPTPEMDTPQSPLVIPPRSLRLWTSQPQKA